MSMKQFKAKKDAVNEVLNEYLKNLLRQQVLTWKGSNACEGDSEQMRN